MKKTLILTVGLPRSGKSTWAKQQGVPVVNPDSVRLALHGQRMLESAEPMVWAMAKYMVHALFIAGHSTVILDATNLTKKSRGFWAEFAQQNKLTLVFAIAQASCGECIKRAEERNDKEIVPVIERMYREMEWPFKKESDYFIIMEGKEDGTNQVVEGKVFEDRDLWVEKIAKAFDGR